MKILVTGGGGFLGRAVVDQLLARGDEVTSVSRGDYPELRALGVQTHRGDLADEGVARRACEGQDAVIHVAARAGVWGPEQDYRRANVEATEQILAACREHQIGLLVYTSSPSVTFSGGDACGVGPDHPYPTRHLNHYTATKAAAEQMVLAANGPGLRTCALRPHLIFGPGDPHLIPRLLERARAGRLRIVGPGDNRVDLTYVDDAARAHVLALDALRRAPDHEEPPCGRPYFISQDDPVELWPWINGLLARMNIAPVRSRVPRGLASVAGAAMEGIWGAFGLSGEPPMTRFLAAQLATSHWYDMEPARRDLGYAPQVTMEEALQRLVRWLEQEQRS